MDLTYTSIRQLGCTRRIIAMFCIYFAYLLFGSIIFVTLESFEDIRTRNKSMEEIYLTKKICDALIQANFSVKAIDYAFQNQKEILKGTTLPLDVRWVHLYGDNMFFAFVLISTIGYGHVIPISQHGKLVCIIYTLFGLPIHLIMMRVLSYEFRRMFRKALKVAQRFFSTSKFVLVISSSLYFLFWLGIFIFIPAYIITKSENWPYSRGAYFSFLSLNTIGLGDYLAGVSPHHFEDKLHSLNVVGMFIWMVFGMGFFSMTSNMMSYKLGTGILDTLDCKCQKRTSAKRRFKPLLELIKDLNWQLVKFKPDNFPHLDYIEHFKELLIEDPQDITHDMLLEMFRIVIELRGQANDQLSELCRETKIPRITTIQQARDNLPDILSQESVTVTFRAHDAHRLRFSNSLPVLNSETESGQQEDRESPKAGKLEV